MAKITEVKEINLPELELYASRSEVKLYRHDEPEPGLFAAESLKVIDRALAAGYRPVSFLFEKNVFREKAAYLAERFPDTDIYLADEETMTGITGYRLTGGALSLMRRKNLPSFADICTGKKRLAVLEDVENPANVGAIIRSAEAMGAHGVLLPKRRSAKINETAVKTSAGAVNYLPIAQIGNPVQTVSKLKAQGFWAVGADMAGDTLESQKFDFPTLLVIGSEGKGISRLLKEKLDYLIKIPMKGKINSLNASVAAGILIYEVIRRRKLNQTPT